MQSRFKARLNNRGFYLAVAAGLMILFTALAVGSALTKRPWSDEGWFASPAYNLITKGSMGTTVLEPTGWLKGINQYTYWVVPLHIIAQAGWYEVFGFSLLSMRTLSTAWGLVALVSWFLIMHSLSGNHKVALLAMGLIALDYSFIMGASFGRMDMMCAALGFAAYAAYLTLRERHFALAVLASQILVTASGLTHHLGILAFAGLLFLTFYFDRSKLRWKHAAIGVIPYLIGAALWGLYIMKSPALFITQFGGNAQTGGRMTALLHPLTGLWNEIAQRYLVAFGMGPHNAGHGGLVSLKIFILLAYVAGIIGAISTRAIRRHRGYRALLILAAIYFVILTIYDGQKLAWYLVHTIPIFAAILAAYVDWCWTESRVPGWAIATGVCCLMLLQVGGVVQRMRVNTYQESYVPAVNFLKANAREGALIMGSAELGFALRFPDNLIDDTRLGYYSGRRAKFVVVEEIYEDAFDGARKSDPQAYEYIQDSLKRNYRQVYDQGFYQIYALEDERDAEKETYEGAERERESQPVSADASNIAASRLSGGER